MTVTPTPDLRFITRFSLKQFTNYLKGLKEYPGTSYVPLIFAL
jgi:hypothetical protein